MTVSHLIEKVESGRLSEKELIQLYKDVMGSSKASIEEKAALAWSIEKESRLKFPKAAKRLFGEKDNKAVEVLTRINANMSAEFSLAGSLVKTGVKLGGDQLNGTKYIDRYLSYKNQDRQCAALLVFQDTVESEMTVYVKRYDIINGKTGILAEQYFLMNEVEEAEQLYRQYLQEIAPKANL